MKFDKGHHEFHTLDMKGGWRLPPGYPPGFQEKIIAGELDEKNKRGNRTRILRIGPGAFSTVPLPRSRRAGPPRVRAQIFGCRKALKRSGAIRGESSSPPPCIWWAG